MNVEQCIYYFNQQVRVYSVGISDYAELTTVYRVGFGFFSPCPRQSCKFSKLGFNTINKITLETG